MPGIKDVAQKAGVSISVVSNVLNGTRYVSDELRQKVLEAVQSMDYEVDMVARSMKNNRTMNVGVIITSINRIFFPQVLKGMQNAAAEAGYNLIIHITDDDFDKEKKFVRVLVGSKVDGIILDSVADKNDGAYYEYLRTLHQGKKRIPVMSMERNLSEAGLSSIFIDNQKGGYTAAKHLIEKGCRSIAHIGAVKTSVMSQERTKGYYLAMQEAGLAVRGELLQEGDFSPLSGYRGGKRLLDSSVHFDGIVTDNDQMAIGAMKAVQEYGLRVPEDIRIIGFDNTFISSIVTPAISTINVPKYRMGAEAFRGLCRLMEYTEKDRQGAEETMPLVIEELRTSLLVRRSTEPTAMSNWELEEW